MEPTQPIKSTQKTKTLDQDPKEHVNPKIFILKMFKLSTIIFLLIFFTIIYFASAPFGSFSTPVMMEITSGESLKNIAKDLEDTGVVRSPNFLRFLVSAYGGEKKIKAGVYEFDKPADVFNVAYRLSHQDYGYIPIKLTFPEGINSREVLVIINSKYPNLNNSSNPSNDSNLNGSSSANSTDIETAETNELAEISSKEGYLFPDTYFFPPNADVKMIIGRMYSEYQRKISKYQSEILASGHTEKEIITMASILEEEVKTTEDKKLAADLLWRRIQNGMPLQVDSTLGYINGKKSSDLTLSDLATSSAFNTYRNKGLPPSPISNPGLDAIEAAINPTKNNYLFFLTDTDGKTYFSTTYAEHLRFKKLYIR